MDLFLIDGIGPFFRGVTSRRINWSKIPFGHLPLHGETAGRFWQGVRKDLGTLTERSAALGYNALTLDCLAHLTDHPWYEPPVRKMIQHYGREFRRFLPIIRNAGQRLFVTSDVITTTAAIDQRLGSDRASLSSFYHDLVDRFFEDFPEVEGLILRIGESDGRDIRHPLRSRLHLRTAHQTNHFLRHLAPLFERRKRKLILRTWTVGAHRIGDLLWHRERQRIALHNLDSPALVLSMKPGESDFFRYLPLNSAFFRYEGPKILELQARREYEGAGEFPSFIGWDCERLRDELGTAKNLLGLSVWAQTGGWHRFRRLTFLEPEGFWTELNCRAAVDVFKNHLSAEESVEGAVGKDRAGATVELLRHADHVINKLYYIDTFARQKLFFRRVRIPPLLHLYWDTLFVHSSVRRILRHFVRDRNRAIHEGEAALKRFDRMERLAHDAGLPVDDIRFMRDTFRLLALARRYYFEPHNEDLLERIRVAKKDYKAAWPRDTRPRYRIKTAFHIPPFGPRSVRLLSTLLLRRRRGYRLIDRIFTLNLLSFAYRLFRHRHRDALPKFVRNSAMGIDTIFE